jgi:PD-(D/E)XK endonuclease
VTAAGLSTNRKGAIAEASVIAEATRLGIDVYRPVADHGRFDMVFAFPDGSLSRVQCKWVNREGDVIHVRPRTSRRTAAGIEGGTYAAHEVDAVAAWCEELRRCYYLPIDLVAGRQGFWLRLAVPKNNQVVGVHWAAQYELGAIAQLGERLHGMQEVVGSSPTSSID